METFILTLVVLCAVASKGDDPLGIRGLIFALTLWAIATLLF